MKTIQTLLFITLILLFASCDKDEDREDELDFTQLVGKWMATTVEDLSVNYQGWPNLSDIVNNQINWDLSNIKLIFDFGSAGNVTMTVENQVVENGTYTLKNNVLTLINENNDKLTLKATLNNEILRIDISDTEIAEDISYLMGNHVLSQNGTSMEDEGISITSAEMTLVMKKQ